MGDPERPPRRAAAAWILYDLANTIFSFAIVSTFFPLWLHDDLGLPDSAFAIANAASMLVVAFLAPGFGVLSDRAHRRIPFLIGATTACVAATAVLGLAAWPLALVLFALANVGFQLGLVVYDALLPYVTTPENRGRVSGLGVGVGYGGSFIGLGVGRALLSGHEDRDALVFLASALLFLLFALPTFFLIRESRAQRRVRAAGGAFRAFADGLRNAVGILRGGDQAVLRRYFLGRLLYADAANTMIIFMGVYAVAEAGFTQAAVVGVLATGILGALAVAPLAGLLVDRVGPKRTLDLVLLVWMFGLAVVALVGLLGLAQGVFYPLAFILGGTLGATWTADRPLLIGLAPAGRMGDLFGVYNMMGRFAAVLGPLVWALIVDVLDWGRPAAVLALLVFVVLGFLVLRRVPDPVRPDDNPLGAFLPWRAANGHPTPLPPRWWLRFPFHAFYLAATTILFVLFVRAYGGRSENAPEIFNTVFVYYIPDLFTNLPLTLLHFVTGIWINWHVVQLVYVWVLLLLFGVWLEVREGTLRAVLVFYATSIAAGVLAGALLHVIHANWDATWIDRAWGQGWTGGSAGAFGVMGFVAARSRRPWLLLSVFSFWELNVAYWWLKSYTPAFHLFAMATGFLLARFWMRPRRA